MDFEFLHPNQWPHQACMEMHPPRRHDAAGARYLIDNIHVANTHDGRPVTLTISAWHRDRRATTVEHTTVEGFTVFEFTGSTWLSKDATERFTPARAARVRGAAHTDPITPAIGEHVVALCALWDRWHRSDLRPACIHQDYPGMPAEPLTTPATPPCGPTGYEFGADWLVEPVPTDVVQDIFRHVHAINTAWATLTRS